MSKNEVKAISEYGPYRSFSNGDLETYKGVYDGHEENFQFFFESEKLRRIGIYFYEGSDPKAAAAKWVVLHDSLERKFGKVETPNNIFGTNETERAAFAAIAAKIASGPGKSQMAPLRQPNDAFIFASFYGRDVQGQRIYLVTLYLSKPTSNEPSKD